MLVILWEILPKLALKDPLKPTNPIKIVKTDANFVLF